MFYCAVATWGYGDDTDFIILYVGEDYDKAKTALLNFTFPSEYNNWGDIQYWANGTKIREETVVD